MCTIFIKYNTIQHERNEKKWKKNIVCSLLVIVFITVETFTHYMCTSLYIVHQARRIQLWKRRKPWWKKIWSHFSSSSSSAYFPYIRAKYTYSYVIEFLSMSRRSVDDDMYVYGELYRWCMCTWTWILDMVSLSSAYSMQTWLINLPSALGFRIFLRRILFFFILFSNRRNELTHPFRLKCELQSCV